MILLFIFYVDSISVAVIAAEITWYRFALTKWELGICSWKNKFFTMENSRKFLSLVGENYDNDFYLKKSVSWKPIVNALDYSIYIWLLHRYECFTEK